jgi:hypothetical protein
MKNTKKTIELKELDVQKDPTGGQNGLTDSLPAGEVVGLRW